MSEPDAASAMAETCRNVLTRTLRLRRGESVVIESWTHTLPWANAMVLEARRLGIRPMLLYEDEANYWRAATECKAADVGRLSDAELGAIAKTDGYVFFWGPEDRPRLRALPPDQNSALTAYNGPWYAAAEKAKLRGVRMEIGQATAPAARLYGVNLPRWQETLEAAARVDVRPMARAAARLAQRLRDGTSLHLTHANGTDLTLRLAGRPPTVDDGVVGPEDVRAGNNLTSCPAGAVYVAVDEGFAEGSVVANRTSYPVRGALGGGRWTFIDHRLAEFSYSEGLDRFQAQYEAAGPGRDRPGFLSIGLNPALREAPGLEDFERGTVLIGVGANTAFGGKNKPPFQSWLVVAGGHLELDGRPLIADGELL